MPGVNPPVNEKFYAQLAQMQRDIVAIATQQQLSFTNANSQVILTLGLVPGSNPPAYGLQLIDPNTGQQLGFLGEGPNGLSLTVNGPVNLGGTTEVTGNLNVSGALTVTGDTTIEGTLVLPNASVNNAALVNPVTTASGQDTGGSYALPVASSHPAGGPVQASVSVTVPSGFNAAMVNATVQDAGYNTSGAGGYLYSWVGFSDGSNYRYAPGGYTANTTSGVSISQMVTTVSGLTPGSTLTIQSRPSVYPNAWAASTSNGTVLMASFLFLRL